MAEELRIVRGDTYDIECHIFDSTGAPVQITGNWYIRLESEVINKDSLNDSIDFVIETLGLTTGQFIVTILSSETNIDRCPAKRAHYKFRLFTTDNPQVVKTVSTGNLFFIDEE